MSACERFDMSDEDEITSEYLRPAAAIEAVSVDEGAFDEARAEHYGWCPTCEDFTTPTVRPTESRRECVDCGDGRVCGVVHAVRNGFVVVS